ncbi:MAG: hypothetical protein KAT68_17320 [Bacteroidales bacterium]|nr:hypothetical protein [Bacteroidales bacterium]
MIKIIIIIVAFIISPFVFALYISLWLRIFRWIEEAIQNILWWIEDDLLVAIKRIFKKGVIID